MDLPQDERPQTKMLRNFFRITALLLLVIQVLVGLLAQNVYSRFTHLEEENRLYDNELDDLKTQMQIVQFRLQGSNK
jgi:hypothetical protein